MTIRAIFFAILFVIVFSLYAFFNDIVILQYYLVGSYMPILIFGGIILFILTINPLLLFTSQLLSRHLKRTVSGFVFSAKELAVIVALILSVCFIPSNGLVHHFTFLLMLPHHYERIRPGWQEQKVISLIPSQMLADVSKDENVVLDGFARGLGNTGLPSDAAKVPWLDRTFMLAEWGKNEIPWYAWTRTLEWWMPLIFAFVVATVGLSLIVHRQWAHNEQIPYPIAQFVTSVLPRQGEALGSIFHNRWFQIGLGFVVVFHMNNYACLWWPSKLINIPRTIDFQAFGTMMPLYIKGGGGFMLLPTFYFTALGFAYLIATDVSFSVAVAPIIYAIFTGVCLKYGINVAATEAFKLNYCSYISLGAVVGFMITMLYTGRNHYLNIVRRSLLMRTVDEVKKYEIGGFYLLALGSAVFVALLVYIGLDWQIAVMHVVISLTMFLVLTRVVAETGVFFLGGAFVPGVIVLGIFGEQNISPQMLLIMYLVGSTMEIGSREAFMPYFIHALKIVDSVEERPAAVDRILGRTSGWALAVIGLSLIIAIPVAIFWQYKEGAMTIGNIWYNNILPTWGIDSVVSTMNKLSSQGMIQAATSLSGWHRFAAISPRAGDVIAFSLTLALVLLTSAARFRWPRFPIHPVFFIMMTNALATRVSACFLVGWAVKALVLKFGGIRAYQNSKPFVMGLIAGEMLAGVLIIIISGLYYFWKGFPPLVYSVFSG